MQPILSLRHYDQAPLAHSHVHAQLVFGLDGSLELEIEGRASLLPRHGLAVIPPTFRHACRSPRGSRCLVLDVPDEDWLEARLGNQRDNSRRLLQRAGGVSLAPAQRHLVEWLASGPLADPVLADQGAALLLAGLGGAEAERASASRLPLAAIERYIERHAGHPLQVADLARLAGLSVARFHARFLAETGLTPMEHVRQRRLQLGLRLLRESPLAIGEIASRVGYASQSAFSAALLREYGASPRALRREARDKTR